MRLNDIALLAGLTPGDRSLLLERCITRRVHHDDVLHLAGDAPHRVHLIVDGIVKLSARNGSTGDEAILGIATRGSVVGDVGAVDGDLQPFDAIALTTSTALGMDAQLFVDVVFRNPYAARAIARDAAARTRWIADTALERSSAEVSARLAGRLLDLARVLGSRDGEALVLDLPVGQRDLGKLAGTCRESTCKTLRRMKAQGILDYEGRRLRILRPDTLRMMRCGGVRAER